jgi:hypothetical protein
LSPLFEICKRIRGHVPVLTPGSDSSWRCGCYRAPTPCRRHAAPRHGPLHHRWPSGTTSFLSRADQGPQHLHRCRRRLPGHHSSRLRHGLPGCLARGAPLGSAIPAQADPAELFMPWNLAAAVLSNLIRQRVHAAKTLDRPITHLFAAAALGKDMAVYVGLSTLRRLVLSQRSNAYTMSGC